MFTLCALPAAQAQAFCGFFVGKAGADVFNNASKVVLTRHDDTTTITMASDFEGAAEEFAMVIPSPVPVTREAVKTVEPEIIDHLDAYSAPRLVEYYDTDPCDPIRYMEMAAMEDGGSQTNKSLGVTVEDSYTVGEYDISILSATESEGLQTWLNQNGYAMPEAAVPVLESYIKQGMYFFVAKVNLVNFNAQEEAYLRPLQLTFDSPKFGLPIRLGTVNAKEYQDIFLYVLAQEGRAEATNYATVPMKTNMEVPAYIKKGFPAFYRDMFAEAAEQQDYKALLTEYAWDMSWCDPCAADPLSREELEALGVFWLQNEIEQGNGTIQPVGFAPSFAPDVFITRLHARYTAETFPEDIKLQLTPDRTNFQTRYIINHRVTPDILAQRETEATDPDKTATDVIQIADFQVCTLDTLEDYKAASAERLETEEKNMKILTGWDDTQLSAFAANGEPNADSTGETSSKPCQCKRKNEN